MTSPGRVRRLGRVSGAGACGAFALGLVVLVAGATPVRADDRVQYNRDIRPILTENCFACHGPDAATREAGLRLDVRESAIRTGAIIPGDGEWSEVTLRVTSDDPDEVMPPPASHKTLTSHQQELLQRWIDQGAEYQAHWAFLPAERPEPPAVAEESWVRNPIDRFILKELEAVGLTPAPEADRRTLARRLSLDLTGLPPAPDEVEAFVNDPAPNAYEAFVDRLLASPHWGEHRGRFWLDAARYADTHGIHFDNFREMWSYRDWVINAFNRNLPFDQFTIEQLAGDLLPEPTLDQQIATGFNRCNITTNEGGVIPEEYLVLYTRDRTETVSQVWMGLTAGCAVCHDHKYDPLSQEEFYQLAAFFNNTTQGAMDGNIKDTPPVVFVPALHERERWDELSAELADLRSQLDDRKQDARGDFDAWLADANVESLASHIPSEGLQLRARLNDRVVIPQRPDEDEDQDQDPNQTDGEDEDQDKDKTPTVPNLPGSALEIAGAGDFETDDAFTVGAWVLLERSRPTGALVARMDDDPDLRGWDLWIEGGRVGTHIVHTWRDDALKVVSTSPLEPERWHHVLLTYDGSAKAEGVTVYVNGQPQETRAQVDRLTGTIRTTAPLTVGQRHTTAKLEHAKIHDLHLYERALSAEEVGQLAGYSQAVWLAATPPDQRPPDELDILYAWWLSAFDEPTRQLREQETVLVQEESGIRQRGTVAHVTHERDEEPIAYILNRGEYDQRGEKVGPATPEVLPPMPPDLPKNRLGFAQWLLRPEHPLTARVTVNRFWQEVFGEGLVRTAGDFGLSGELPSHPELLDWLAVEFRESGWDVKRFFKLLVTSATYRQSAVVTPQKLEYDPDNLLLSRGPRFRMDAEMIRDYALTASGLLVDTLGGPSVKPYQPEGVWEAVAMPESNTRSYERDSGPALYRRSLYTFWKRAAPPASMEIFNAPNREVCTVQRVRTNTPLQALVILNDIQFIEAARHLAQRTLQNNGDAFDDRIVFMAQNVLARPLRPEESEVLAASLDGLLDHYRTHPEDAAQLLDVGESPADPNLDPATLAAWTMLANQLLNLDEVLNK